MVPQTPPDASRVRQASVVAGDSHPPRWAAGARIGLLLVLAVFYTVAAWQHGLTVNTSKARGDQSGYLYDAQILYHDWHDAGPPRFVDRNRMPLYGAYLALFYNPRLSDDDFFVLGKGLNIGLSLALLALVALVASRALPPKAWMNLTIFAASGYFVFKAAYVQSELLFYALFFLAFAACCAMFAERRPTSTLGLGALCGCLLGLAHLAKAAMLPFVAVFLLTYFGNEAAGAVMRRRRGDGGASRAGITLVRIAAGTLVAISFLAVLSPYLLHSKRVFGRYFYNVNSTFYVWYDDWPHASVGTYRHGDHVGWPHMPTSELPSASRYWREHSLPQIAARLLGGFEDMAVRSYRTFWFLQYLVVFAAISVWLIACQKRAFWALVRRRAGLFAFLVLYAATYTLLTAFYNPISGTGTTRFLLAHLLPVAFVVMRLWSAPPFAGTSTTLCGARVTATHAHLLVSILLGLDILFTIWPRLMTTYGGF